MGAKSKIEWTDATWNPIRGCSRVSEGCRNCYAERVAARFSGPGKPYEGLAVMKSDGPHWTGQIRFVTEHLGDPIRWRNPRRIFVNSMSDLFHEAVPDDDIDQIFAVMALAPQHIFQVLTKRPERMLAYLSEPGRRSEVACAMARESFDEWTLNTRTGELPTLATWDKHAGEMRIKSEHWPLPNVWLGVSAEDQTTATERIRPLLQTPATVRWVSFEPLLGHIDFHPSWVKVPRIDWVVAGGESGPGARPMHPEWARYLRDQCRAALVPFFFKQWGEYIDPHDSPDTILPDVKDTPLPEWPGFVFVSDGGEVIQKQSQMRDNVRYRRMQRVGKKAAGRLLDGREWNEYPETKIATALSA